jgi:RHS repeat-associated protein
VTDNLNRATSIGGVTCTNDLLGNRLTSGSNAYHWDSLNRMTSYNSTAYTYRADGMRTSKSNSTGSTSYRYDGQMGMEDIDYAPGGAVSKVTDYGIGARGIDAIYVTQNGTTSANYPIYDAHGNMISTLSRQGTGNYSTSALRTFDAWGQIRIGAQTGDPKGRYCANLGHKQDDESGLIYMRARYYEPTSGRFISEDPKAQGNNWFAYSYNDPINWSDTDGKLAAILWAALFFVVAGLLNTLWPARDPVSKAIKQVISSVISAFGAIRLAGACLEADEGKLGFGGAIGAGLACLVCGAYAEIALQQLADAVILMEMGSDASDWCKNSAGNPFYQFGL